MGKATRSKSQLPKATRRGGAVQSESAQRPVHHGEPIFNADGKEIGAPVTREVK